MNKDLKVGLGIIGILIICFCIILFALKGCNTLKEVENSLETANLTDCEVLDNKVLPNLGKEVENITSYILTKKQIDFEDAILNNKTLKHYNGMEQDFIDYLKMKFKICKFLNNNVCPYEINGKVEIKSMLTSVNKDIKEKVQDYEKYLYK